MSTSSFLRLVLSLAIALSSLGYVSPAFAGNCENPRYASKKPDECGGEPPPPPPGQERMLQVTVRFGDENDYLTQPCDDDDSCIDTTFTAVGNVVCSSQMCDFVGTVSELDSAFFNIPPSLLNLLAMTSIRGTRILPELCFFTDSGFPFTAALAIQKTSSMNLCSAVRLWLIQTHAGGPR